MERLNDFIALEVKQNLAITASECSVFKKDSFFISHFSLCAKDCLFDLTVDSYELIVRIEESYFEKYQETFDVFYEKQTICCNTQAKVLEIVNCNLTGLNRKIYLESNILFLLYQIQKNNLVFQLNCNTCSFLNKPLEKDKIVKAKEYITENLDTNISIQNIASYVGTNQCYLKKGFKELYGQTVFEFVLENRMIKANEMLQQANLSIGDIALQIGYSSVSSFSQAYKNFFGYSPSQSLKQNISLN
jgi:AraC-like DNA-binding protein